MLLTGCSGKKISNTNSDSTNKTNNEGVVYIVLNGVNISSSSSAKVDESGDLNSAIFSTSDLTITGSGTLNVTSDFNDGVTTNLSRGPSGGMGGGPRPGGQW